MSAAQQLATQVGEVAGIQVLITVQESYVRRAGLTGEHGSALLPAFHQGFWVGGLVAVFGVACALFIRDLPRIRSDRATGMAV